MARGIFSFFATGPDIPVMADQGVIDRLYRQNRLRIMLAKQFCSVTGGPCVYDGSSMKAVHSNLKIDRAAFNAVVEVLQGAMEKHGVPFRAQNQLLAKLAPMYRDIETR